MAQPSWPHSLKEAVNICLLTLTDQEKQALRNTSEENLIASHFGWAKNIRNQFGLWQGNEALIQSCKATEPDGASMVIVEAVWKTLNKRD